MGNILKF